MANDVVPFKRKNYAPLGEEITVAAMVSYAREHSREAIEYLAGVMRDKDEDTALRIRATQLLLDRGLGRPAQSVEVRGGFDVNIRSGMRGLREAMLADQARREAMGPLVDTEAIYDENEGEGS